MTLKDLLKLSSEQGKVVIMGEDGEVKGVFLPYAEFAKLSGREVVKLAGPDPEKINREILEAQLKDNVDLGNVNLEVIEPQVSMPTPISNIISERARELFVSKPFGRAAVPQYDMREEVVDPSFGQPQVEVESEEEIKPNFDDV